YGKITLPGILGVSPWIVIPVFIIALLFLFAWFEKLDI
ncbi:MAG: YeeE/YedE family protein, partial [Deltaproteobacteria bacterium]